MAQEIMSIAIINCTQLLFSCVTPSSDGTKVGMHCREIVRKIEQIYSALKATMYSILPPNHTIKDCLWLNIHTAESDEAKKSIQNGQFDSIFKLDDKKIVWLFPPSVDSQKPRVFTDIKKIFGSTSNHWSNKFESMIVLSKLSKGIFAPKEMTI